MGTYDNVGKVAFLGGSRSPDPPDLAPPAPTGAGRPSAAAPPFWEPLLAPEAPGPGVWGAGAPTLGKPILESCVSRTVISCP